MQVFWTMHFVLPKAVGKHIEQLFRNFLWSGSTTYNHYNKVAWEVICSPKSEGGLGLRNVVDWNHAAMAKHLWAICSKQDSLWVKWSYKNAVNQ